MKIIIIEANDWSGFYIDGVLIEQGHSIRYDELLDALVKSCRILVAWESLEVRNDWMEDAMSLPKNVTDIPKNAFITKTKQP